MNTTPNGEREAALAALPDLIDKYWDLAYAEGKEGRDHDTENGDAQETRIRIDRAIALLQSPAAEIQYGNCICDGGQYAPQQKYPFITNDRCPIHGKTSYPASPAAVQQGEAVLRDVLRVLGRECGDSDLDGTDEELREYAPLQWAHQKIVELLGDRIVAPSPASPEVGGLVERAEAYAARYENDDRQDIKTDVLNAFYAGAALAAPGESHLSKWSRVINTGTMRHLPPSGAPGEVGGEAADHIDTLAEVERFLRQTGYDVLAGSMANAREYFTVHPQPASESPPSDAVGALPAKWRDDAKRKPDAGLTIADAINGCADELAAALQSPASSAAQAGKGVGS